MEPVIPKNNPGVTKKKSKANVSIVTSRVFNAIASIASGVIIILFLLSVGSMWISPVRLVTPAFLGLVFPILLFFQALVTIYWLLAGKWRWIVACLVVLLLSFSAIKVYTPLHRFSADKLPQDHIKVLSYNVMAFGFLEHNAMSPNPILQYLKNSDADIICLQEAKLYSEDTPYVSLEDIKEYLTDYKYIDFNYAQPDGGTGMMILSKFPILKAERIRLESTFNGAMKYILNVKGKDMMVINCHLESFKLTMQDGYSYLRMAKAGDAKGLRESMGGKFAPAYRRRAIQANHIHEAVLRSPVKNVLVCGDFNDTPISYARHKIAEGMRDAYMDTGYGPGYSFNKGMYIVRIDHIMCSPGMRPYGCRVDQSIKISDHQPIMSYFTFEP